DWSSDVCSSDLERREAAEFGGHSLDRDVVDRLVAIDDLRAALRVEHHRRYQRAVAAHRPDIVHRDAWVVAELVEFLIAEHQRELLHAERIGPGLVEDGIL